MGWVVVGLVVVVLVAVVVGVVWYWWTVVSGNWQLARAQREEARRIKRQLKNGQQ